MHFVRWFGNGISPDALDATGWWVLGMERQVQDDSSGGILVCPGPGLVLQFLNCFVEDCVQLVFFVSPQLEAVVELENSGILVCFITAETEDTEKGSMDNAWEEPWWVCRMGRNIEV